MAQNVLLPLILCVHLYGEGPLQSVLENPFAYVPSPHIINLKTRSRKTATIAWEIQHFNTSGLIGGLLGGLGFYLYGLRKGASGQKRLSRRCWAV